jgi:hypothetical protein
MAARAVELGEKHQIFQILAHARCALGHARAQLGRAPEGIALIRQGIQGALESAARFPGITLYGTLLAQAQQRSDAIEEALETIEQALQANPAELVYRPETLRVRGELRLALRQADLAEADFRGSLRLARQMDARAWELRTTMSLARLLAAQGQRNEVHSILGEIYGWFSEGFDTPDLRDAKALLDELSE